MASSSMNRVSNLLPRRHLFFTPNSRCVWPFRADTPNIINPLDGNMGSSHLPLTRHKDRFGDNEPSTTGSALMVVLLHCTSGDCSDGAVASERSHEDTVANRDGAEFEGAEEACDG